MSEHPLTAAVRGAVLDVPDESPAQRAATASEQAFREKQRASEEARGRTLGEARATHEEQLREAQDAHRRAQWAAREAETAIAPAQQRLKDFDREHGGRLEDAHHAIDAARERAVAEMRKRLVNSALNLATAGQPDSGQALDLAPLASAYAAANPAFTEEIHRLLDEIVEAGDVNLSRLSAEEIAAARAPLRDAVKTAEAALDAARGEVNAAAHFLTQLER